MRAVNLADGDAVRAFEHAGWEKAAAQYQATFARASGQFVDALLDAAAVAVGERLVDLCCGTGVVTAAAAARGAAASGLDFSAAMLAIARARHPALRFEEGDAETLPYAGRAIDVVVANFGIHHVPRPERALAEAHRVLRPGGRFAFTTWATPAENVAWRLLFDAIRAVGQPAAARTPPSGGNLGEPAAVVALLRAAGFADCQVELVEREWELTDAADLVRSLRRGTVRTAALIEAQPPAAVPAIEAAIAGAAAPYRRGAGYAIPIVAVLARGVKPG